MHEIEIDDDVYADLGARSFPFETPNDVLRRFLLNGVTHPNIKLPPLLGRPPKALAQTLQVACLVMNGVDRSEATKQVASLYKVSTPTVIDKYCRQLGMTSAAFDGALSDIGYLKELLHAKYPEFKETIENYLHEEDYSGTA